MNFRFENSAANLVEIQDVHYSRDDRKIFSGLDMQIPRGKVTAVLGPSGAGKTTLLNLITGQLNPDQGAVLFEGKIVCPCSRRRLYAIRRQMGVLFQQGALLTNLNVFENVAFPLREHTGLHEELIRQIVIMKLNSVGLRAAWQHMPSQLSGGMARRVALARAKADCCNTAGLALLMKWSTWCQLYGIKLIYEKPQDCLLKIVRINDVEQVLSFSQ